MRVTVSDVLLQVCIANRISNYFLPWFAQLFVELGEIRVFLGQTFEVEWAFIAEQVRKFPLDAQTLVLSHKFISVTRQRRPYRPG